MKNSSQNKKGAKAPRKSTKAVAPATKKEPAFSIPPGSKLSDVFMDAQQVALELNISKRTIHNMRKRGKLSFTSLGGKMFYFRQEIAAILEANKNSLKENITLRKIKEALSKRKKK